MLQRDTCGADRDMRGRWKLSRHRVTVCRGARMIQRDAYKAEKRIGGMSLGATYETETITRQRHIQGRDTHKAEKRLGSDRRT